MTLVNMSVIENIPQPDYLYKDRKLFFIHYICGEQTDLTFTFDIETPLNYQGATIDIAVNAIYLHDKKNNKIPFYLNMIKQFPSWADVTPYLAQISSYVI